MLFDERIEKSEVDEILHRTDHKAKPHSAHSDSHGYSLIRLRKGIEVIKHHYSKPGCERVILKLSADGKSLSYKPVKPNNIIYSKLRGARKMSFTSDIAGVLYGPSSSTFLARKQNVIKQTMFNSMINMKHSNLKRSNTTNTVNSMFGVVNQLSDHDEDSENGGDTWTIQNRMLSRTLEK